MSHVELKTTFGTMFCYFLSRHFTLKLLSDIELMNKIISCPLDLTVKENNVRRMAVMDNQVIHPMHIQYVIIHFL